MSLLLLAPNRNNMEVWKEVLLEEDPNINVEIWPDVKEKERVQFIVSWNQPKNVLNQYPNLKVVSSLGAGVDHLLGDESLPDEVSITRLVPKSLIRQMKEYVLNAVLNYQRNMYAYFRQRAEGVWREYPNKKPEEVPVGIMGLGKLGRPTAETLAKNGYIVNGWSNREKNIPGVHSFESNRVDQFLNRSRILVCMLPLTNETKGILALDFFKKLMHPAFVINVGRGEHLVEEDLIYAMDKGWIDQACLDVFPEEPLPERHPFWGRPDIMITPHSASFTSPQDVAGQVVENYKRVLSGMELLNEVDRQRGY